VRKNLILIKLGGSVITDKGKPFTARRSVILRLGREIGAARGGLKNTDLVIAHGSGSFGHTVADKYQTQLGISSSINEKIRQRKIQGFAEVARAAREINRIVISEFLRVGLPAVSFAPLSFTYDGKTSEQFIKPVAQALEIGLLPVTYGDVVMAAKNGFCIYSGEKTLNLLARNFVKKYRKVRIIEAGDTDGVYDAGGKTIPLITPKNFSGFAKLITKSDTTDVTGGMLHKVEEALELAKKLGIETVIINGTVLNNLKRVINGEEVVLTIVRS
jgi:isopentenyl phosphate kinase